MEGSEGWRFEKDGGSAACGAAKIKSVKTTQSSFQEKQLLKQDKRDLNMGKIIKL